MKLFQSLMFLSLFVFLFNACKDDDDGMNLDNTFTVTIENVVSPAAFFQSGQFAVPVGGSEAAPIFPGDAYEFTVQAGPNVTPGDGGTRLSFATMFVQSNDLFLAPDGAGIALYDDSKNPIGGGAAIDVTDQISIWDAGTEVNDLTGSDSQKPQQDPMAGDVGTDENGIVREIMNNSDGINDLPNASEVIKVTITNQNDTEFLVRIENVSNGMTIATPAQGAGTTAAVPMSPGVYAVHTADNPLFTVGEAASAGIEDIAEDGFIDVATTEVTSNTGLIIPLSPGAWAVHEGDEEPLYELNKEDLGQGLEAIAEDGAPATLATFLSSREGVSASGMFNTPVGAADPAAIGPGGRYSFTFTAMEGEKLSLATMMVQSNDWFYSFGEDGIDLYSGNTPLSGDITGNIALYDAGTEEDEFPGAGLNQVIRQSAANAGVADDNTNVRRIDNLPANVPPVNQVIKVTITAQ